VARRAGNQPLEIKRHAGHKRFSTTDIYLREADTLRESFGTVFPDLPAVLTSSAGVAATVPEVGDLPNSAADRGGAEGNRSRRDGDSRPESSGIAEAELPSGADDPGHKSATAAGAPSSVTVKNYFVGIAGRRQTKLPESRTSLSGSTKI